MRLIIPLFALLFFMVTAGAVFGQRGVACKLKSLPSIQFNAGAKLSEAAPVILESVAKEMNNNPDCNVKVMSYMGPFGKRAQQLSWDRVSAVINYLVEKQGISENRFIFSSGNDGSDPNTVDLVPTTETGPNAVPAPFPNLSQPATIKH